MTSGVWALFDVELKGQCKEQHPHVTCTLTRTGGKEQG